MNSYRISGPDGTTLPPLPADTVEFTQHHVLFKRQGVLVLAVRADEVSSVTNVNNDPW